MINGTVNNNTMIMKKLNDKFDKEYTKFNHCSELKK